MANEIVKTKKSSIIKDTLILFVITMVAGFALGLVYDVTLPAIQERRLQAKLDAYKAVFTEATDFTEDESLNQLAQEAAGKVFEEKGLTNVAVDEVRIATDSTGNKLGYVVMATTQEGYGGAITVLVGYTMNGTVNGIEILTINETAGLGAKAAEKSFKDQYANKKVTEFVYTKTGAAKENEIDAISGATITTSAVTGAVNAGIAFITDLADTTIGGGQNE